MTAGGLSLRAALVALAALLLSGGDAGAAQSLGLGGRSDAPIQVYADSGIEWDQNTRRYIARGNAKAIKGTTTVYGDTLTAHYRELPGGNTEVYRLEAAGRVRIVSPTETAHGDKAVYDVKKGELVITGRHLRFVTASDIITARDSLEYYEQKSLAVARGNAVARPTKKGSARSGGRTVRADTLAAHFRDRKSGGNEIDRLEAYDNVVVSRPGEVVRGQRAIYRPDKETANIWGKVRITRNDNQVNGDYAEVNFKTGISRITSRPDAPVRALIQPDSRPAPGAGQGR